MADLLKKLTLLAKTSLNDLVPDFGGEGDTSPRRAQRQLKTLQDRVDQAEQIEAQARALIAQFEDEVAGLDAQADDAIGQGREEAARYALTQRERARQRLAIAEAELRDIQRTVAELVAQARQAQTAVETAMQKDAAASGSAKPSATTPAKSAEAGASAQPDRPPSSEAQPEDEMERRRQRLSKR